MIYANLPNHGEAVGASAQLEQTIITVFLMSMVHELLLQETYICRDNQVELKSIIYHILSISNF